MVRPVMAALVSANIINAGANWVFVYGHFGLPALGVTGSAYATPIARLYMALVLLIVILGKERRGRLAFTMCRSSSNRSDGPARSAGPSGGPSVDARGRRVRDVVRISGATDAARPRRQPDRH